MKKPIDWASIAATLAAIAGVIGTILTPLLGSQLSTAVEAVIEAISGVLVVIPSYHVSVVAKTRALTR